MDSIKKFYKNKRVLVIGATGFKGAWLCSWLMKLGAKVSGLGYNPNYIPTSNYSRRLAEFVA